MKEEISVIQLANYVSKQTAYHHSEDSLCTTIIGLAQDFVGTNNINLLEPIGWFGNRHGGCKRHAAAHYIHTRNQRGEKLRSLSPYIYTFFFNFN